MGKLGSKVLRVLVVDDEALGRHRILELLADEPDAEVVGSAADGVAAVDAIRSLAPDLVFLDVQMPRMTGLDVMREIGPAGMPATIFVTAYDDYALNAFDYAAIDYLVKPFEDERFREAFRRAARRIEADAREQLHDQLLSLLNGQTAVSPPAPAAAGGYLERIAVPLSVGRTRVVPVDQIDYITASGTYAQLHVGSDRYLLRESMQDLDAKLDPARFMRIHRSAIVRLELVETLVRSRGRKYEVLLRGGVRLLVGRSRREALERRMGRER